MFNRNLSLIFGIVVGIAAAATVVTENSNRKPRIFKGEYDTKNEHRYHVAILKLLPNDTTQHTCGGAILNARYVLTAAHCVYGLDKTELVVRSGWNKDSKEPWRVKREFFKVSKIMYLKDYHYTACRHHQNDIAILKVSKSFDLADDLNYSKVQLPVYYADYESVNATFTGYGVERIAFIINKKDNNTMKRIVKYPEELKYMQTKVLSIEECKRTSNVIVTNGNICTVGENPKGFSCIGDSGGPLVYEGAIIGIRNSHNNTCIHSIPEMFTRVSSFLSFINKVLNQEFSHEIVYL